VGHRSEFRVEKMCKVLNISRSGFYKWQSKQSSPPSERSKQREKLAQRITYVFTDHKQRLGSPRIMDQLRKEGFSVSEKTVGRVMKKLGLRSCMVKKFRVATTDSKHDLPISPNLLDQKFATAAPNQVWVTDITYIPCREGKLYLANVLDLCTRKLVGWALGSRMTVDLVLSALDQAFEAKKPPQGLIHHSDRGSQYASSDYRERLEKYKMVSSMSRKGNCYDNAVIEAFHSILKRELVYQTKFATRQQAYEEIYEYVEFYYNRKRTHSSLGYFSPDYFEAQYYANQTK
jgi:putative transposase